MKSNELFLEILKTLDTCSVLKNLIIIGSWAFEVYKAYFDNTSRLSPVRTQDLDLLVRNPPRIREKVNLPEILKSIGFQVDFSNTTGLIKYRGADLDIELLINKKGAGMEEVIGISQFSANAQPLRYLSLLEDNTIETIYRGIPVTVPEPAAYVLHKYLVSTQRLKPEKAAKDAMQATELGEYLISERKEGERMRQIFDSVPAKWKPLILKPAEKHSETIYRNLTGRERRRSYLPISRIASSGVNFD
jgi:hypothetical protein